MKNHYLWTRDINWPPATSQKRWRQPSTAWTTCPASRSDRVPWKRRRLLPPRAAFPAHTDPTRPCWTIRTWTWSISRRRIRTISTSPAGPWRKASPAWWRSPSWPMPGKRRRSLRCPANGASSSPKRSGPATCRWSASSGISSPPAPSGRSARFPPRFLMRFPPRSGSCVPTCAAAPCWTWGSTGSISSGPTATARSCRRLPCARSSAAERTCPSPFPSPWPTGRWPRCFPPPPARRACRDAIREGRIDPPQMPHAEILYIMQLMDGLRRDWGVRFPMD